MVIIAFLLLSSLSYVLSTSTKTAENCIVGEKWTDNYIRFECYAGTGSVLKGVRPIGCAPNNTDSMIEAGSTYDAEHFTYQCIKSGDIMSYEIINCRDSEGNSLAISETRKMSDGSTLTCTKDESGKVNLSEEKSASCTYEGKTYSTGTTWTIKSELKASVDGEEKVMGKSIEMECIRSGSGYAASPTGCVTSAGETLKNGGYGVVNSLFVKCSIAKDGTVSMTVVDESEMTCSFDGKTLAHNEKYTKEGEVDEYKCSFGNIKKTGCDVNGTIITTGSPVYVSGTTYLCDADEKGVFSFGNLTGCTLPNGVVKKFSNTWINGTEYMRCDYKITGSNATALIRVIGCAHNKKKVDQNKIVESGDEVLKCANVEGTWKMRNLTEEESASYYSSKGGSKSVIGGSGGSGSGGDVTAQPTTAIVDEATTTFLKVFTSAVSGGDSTADNSEREVTTDGTDLEFTTDGNEEESSTSRSVDAKTTAAITETTKTVNPTTTKQKKPKADVNPAASQLITLKYYYNYGQIVHAFCSTSGCVTKIQNNGIGYDMKKGFGNVGRVVNNDKIAEVKAACPNGGEHLRLLCFRRVNKHYEHNFNRDGLRQGWVAVKNGACGATKGIKYWKSRVSDDWMYSTNLENNSYYNGRVQKGGAVQFYVWN